MTEPRITYEGIDTSEHEAHWLKAVDLPGTKVRFNTEAKVHGIDPHDTMDSLGMDALTISKTIARGVEQSDGMGGTRTATSLEYEFEGKEGRHNAKQFMEEGGRDHMYGVVLVRDDRMWAVPIHDDQETGKLTPDGPAREVVGFSGRNDDNLHPDGFDGMKATLAGKGEYDGPAAGEFYSQPRDGHNAPGPIVLLGSPWQSGASKEELEIANTSIDKAIERETLLREDPVRFHIGEMEGASKAFRAERPVRTDQSPAAAVHEALIEANYLSRGRDLSDGSVRMAAAMLATEGREDVGVRLTSNGIADSMMPTSERRGALAQAAAALSAATTARSKGPVPDSAMPPFGAAMTRKGAER
jgi:hypothetical protein